VIVGGGWERRTVGGPVSLAFMWTSHSWHPKQALHYRLGARPSSKMPYELWRGWSGKTSGL
jgi:hypothetical protein